MTDRRPIPPPPPKPRTKRAKKNSCVVLTRPTLAMPQPRNKLTPVGEFHPVLSTEDGITDWEAHAVENPDTPNLKALGLVGAIDYASIPLSEQAAVRKVARENGMIWVGATNPQINTNRL